ncbi:MAG: carbon-nitrogen hydrolase family protein [Bacteroidota bacterium]|nr:carbon-nitrogen hydrolase family protein [Bacteroidota bacterium]MDP4244820.1 carbon-nitrogen hydrolase family protein [Bacteroidota bacterium]MDP4252573.1 carbon-nitrogen hydrolase family protein [Bacteroidota bacterium]MDP4258421.1 carbon-nitrogen hydrolase family protein [Bacteroidota bacterium]
MIVSIAQITPAFLDREATIAKAIMAINEAASNGAKLILFPEAFIPGYPEWVWTNPPGRKGLSNPLYEALLENSLSDGDASVEKLRLAAKKAKLFVVMGINERNAEASNASLYNTLLYIDDKGNLLGKHRKLVPTSGERLVWAPGDGSTLEAYNTEIGKLGGLICWENYMPLARYAMYAKGVQVYVAPTWDYGEVWISTLRHIAKEGGMFVLGACMPMKVSDIPDKYEFKRQYDASKEWINPGDSVIINPKGDIIAGPLHQTEGILYAELDMALIAHGKWSLDVAGHYARPDVFHFGVNRTANKIMG